MGYDGEVLRELSADGRLIREIGRRGSGPSEYLSIDDVAVASPTSIAVLDNRQLRVVWISTNEPQDSTMYFVPQAAMLEARLRGDTLLGLMVPAADRHGDTVTARIVRIQARGVGDVASADAGYSVPARAVALRTALQPIAPFFLVRPLWSISPRGDLTYADGASDTFVRISPDGSERILVSTGAPRVPVSARDITAQREALLRRLPRVGRTQFAVQIEQAAADAATEHPTYTAILGGSDGGTWLQRGSSIATDSVRWDVVNAAGGLEGFVVLPRDAAVVTASASVVVVVMHDATNVPWIQVFRSPIDARNQ